MYSQRIVERNLAKISDALGISLRRYDDGLVDDMTDHLQRLVKDYDDDGQPKSWVREPTKQEWEYITNERLICRYDFRYVANRYFHIQLVDPDGSAVRVDRLGRMGFMRTQEMLLDRLSAAEEEMYDAYDRKESIFGLLFFIHKARQTGFTAIARMMEKQRTLFWPDTMSLAASINEDMVHELYHRDKTIYVNLPWFLRPPPSFDVKDSQLGFKGVNTMTLYHQSNQKGGMGTGRTISIAHLTECALWDMAGGNTMRILTDLFPAIPKSLNTLYMMESTALGMGGFWYDQVDLIQKGKSRFKLFFCPWYAADLKYTETAPIDWTPSDFVINQAKIIEETSSAYLGYTLRPTRGQLYWYENTMNEHTGRLFTFFSNYPTTIEESFQNSGDCAFQPELIKELSAGISQLYGAYDVNQLM